MSNETVFSLDVWSNNFLVYEHYSFRNSFLRNKCNNNWSYFVFVYEAREFMPIILINAEMSVFQSSLSIDWLTDWSIELIDQIGLRLIDLLTDRLIDRLIDWLTDRLIM